MSANKKPRKAYRPRPITRETMVLALSKAAKPAMVDREEVLEILRQAVAALRNGWATELQWSITAGSVAVALAIEQQGIVRGLRAHFVAAEQALQAIYDRALVNGHGKWARVTLYYQELDALQTLVELHTFQVHQLGRAEMLAAIADAQKQTINQGHTATMAHDLERLAA